MRCRIVSAVISGRSAALRTSDRCLSLRAGTATGSPSPIFDRENSFAFFKLAKDPEDQGESPKMLAPAGSHAELYGWERVLTRPETIVDLRGRV